VDSYVSTLQDTGSVGMYAGAAAHRAQDVVRTMLGELDRLRQESVPQDELQMAKDFVRGRLALSLEDSFAVASWYARQQLMVTEVLSPEQVVARLEVVQAADIQRLAQVLFRAERLNLSVVGPFADNGDGFREAIRF
jgi:predicted Zn-dependent peptidase